MRESEAFKANVLVNPSSSYWLRNAIRDLDRRDPCDADKDIELLTIWMNLKFKDLERMTNDDQAKT